MSSQRFTPLIDPFDRRVRDLRISITDRCNFRCTYCMPEEGMKWLDRAELLSFEEIARLARIFVEYFDFDGIRLTGGEPTVRADLPVLVEKLSGLIIPSTNKPVDLAMTTNGSSLRLIAEDLKAAGLSRLNISLDSLDPQIFNLMARRNHLDKVLDGIEAAIEAGFAPIKINIVMIRGTNDHEIVDFATFGRDKGLQPRFIEFMPLDADGAWTMDKVVPADEIIQKINDVYPIEPVSHGPEPAQRFRYKDGMGEIGVIPSVTKPFCGDCDRVRLTAEGKFMTCLFAVNDFDLRAILRSGGTDKELIEQIKAAVGTKWAGHNIGKVNFIRPSRSMSQIGG
ncbi:MAG: GTP 3',8-cyclase MoaA [Actinomycetota bacterium]|nr:MAG: GTP 3',8-cyclase MoaA [Actinomycetota bacterium]